MAFNQSFGFIVQQPKDARRSVFYRKQLKLLRRKKSLFFKQLFTKTAINPFSSRVLQKQYRKKIKTFLKIRVKKFPFKNNYKYFRRR